MKKKKILFYDTTLRDGSQMEGISLSLRDKLMIAKRLDRFGMHYLEGGWPGSNPKDMEFFRAIKKAGLRHARVAAFGSTRRPHVKVKDDPQLKALLDAGTKTVTIFGKSWNMHVRDVFKVSLKENLLMIYETVAYLKDKKIEVIYDAEHFFDGFKANPDYAIKSLQQAAKAGADNLSLCDTNGGTLPHEIRRAILRVKRAVKTPLGIHCHNDSELAVANSIQAVGEGCALVQGTINGFGERCGNANLVSIIPNLQLKMGIQCFSPSKMKELTSLANYVAGICNMPLMNNQPFTGRSAFAHKGGVHINAMTKNARTYEHIEPKAVGNYRRFLVSELGGKTNIMIKARELELHFQKDSPESKKILTEIQRLEYEGYQFEAAEASFELLVQRLLGNVKPFFKIESVSVRTEAIGDNNPRSVADVKLTAKGEQHFESAEGDGPVNALDSALRKALRKAYPVIDEIHLTDYKVRVVNSEAGTAAKVRVFIEFQDKVKSWVTVGVHENIIEASWKALVEAIEYKLYKG
ncbi:MAG TPA: citramalate synthase [Candidatus Omnitrophota bacterium]|nr:citramalate synthase [Candidatus Omnitrophota bacterium]